MKRKIIIFLTVALCLHTFVFAQQQDIEFTDEARAVIDDTLFVQVSKQDTEAGVYVYVKSLILEQMNVSVQISPEEGSGILPVNICVANVCKDGAFSEPFTIGTTERTGVHFEVESANASPLSGVIQFIVTKNEREGETETRFVKFVNNTSAPVITKQPKSVIDAYPNPANNVVNFQYSTSASTQSASVIIRNMVGKVVKEIVLEETGTAQKKINISELTSGVYFYSFVLDGVVISTKKLVVRR